MPSLTMTVPSLTIDKAKTPFGVFLALLCVFLIYFGPLYSQLVELIQERQLHTVLAAGQVENQSLPSNSNQHQHHSHQHPMPAMAHATSPNQAIEQADQAIEPTQSSLHYSHQSHHGHHSHHGHTNGSINLLEACGYCALLFHLSWLDVKTFDIIPLDFEPYPSVFYAVLVRKYLAIFTPLKPRAPPTL